MNNAHCTKFGPTLAGVLALIVLPSRADTFGGGTESFTIDFVEIGNPGNADDTGEGSGIYSTPYGGVGYNYRMGITEVPHDWITKARRLGLTTDVVAGPAGAEASQPAAFMTWFEAAAFVNFLNTSTGHQKAYQLSGVTVLTPWGPGDAWQIGGENLYRHKDAYYFLPSEDEWYKSAYHYNDGVTANYWDYATGSYSVPDGNDFAGDSVFDAVFIDGDNHLANPQPNSVTNAGVASPYGTFGQNGNVFEWVESAMDGGNNSSSPVRALRGGNWTNPEIYLRSSDRSGLDPGESTGAVGFRVASVASVPEPSSALLLLGSGWMGLLRRRR